MVMWNEPLSEYWMSWDSSIEENSAISMMCFFFSVWKMEFDFLTEHDFKGDVNEIEDNMCVLKVNLLLPPQPEIMLSKMMELSKSLKEAHEEIKQLKEEVSVLKTVVVSNEGNEGDEDRKRQRP